MSYFVSFSVVSSFLDTDRSSKRELVVSVVYSLLTFLLLPMLCLGDFIAAFLNLPFFILSTFNLRTNTFVYLPRVVFYLVLQADDGFHIHGVETISPSYHLFLPFTIQ